MERLLHIADDGTRSIQPPTSRHERTDGWTWLDVTGATTDQLSELASGLSLDRQSRDDLFEAQFPKVDDLADYLFVVAHALAADDVALRTVEVVFIVGRDWIVTVHDENLPSIDFVFERALKPNFALDGPTHLLARLLEFVGQRYLPLLDELDMQILDLEDAAVEGVPAVLPDIHALRRDVSLLRRVLGPQRRMLATIERLDWTEQGRAQRDLSDAIDHHERILESLESAHALVATLLDTYRGAAAERMNETMKVLTVFSAIILPLSLIAGVYGMNFRNMPELDNDHAYFVTLGVMGVIAVGLWIYFVRRGFIGGPSLRDLARPARTAGRIGRGLASVATLPVRTVGTVGKTVGRTVKDTIVSDRSEA